MMAQLYAIIASLPFLKWGDHPPMDMAQFHNWCNTAVNPDLKILTDWEQFNHDLRVAFAQERQTRLGWPLSIPSLQIDPKFIHDIHFALDHPDPLETEKAFEHIRWNFLEIAETGHYFDQTKFVCWQLKLEILLRLDKFRESEGRTVFDRMHSHITESIQTFYNKGVST